MAKKKVAPPQMNPYNEQRLKEEKELAGALRREMNLLVRKVGGQPLASAYYAQMKELLEDLMMMELAQKAVTATMAFQTRNKIIEMDAKTLRPFDQEMERAKTLKLITGVLSLSGYLDTEGLIKQIALSLYTPSVQGQVPSGDIVSEIKKVLDDYVKKLPK